VQPPQNNRYLSAESETLENWAQPTNITITDNSESVTLANGIVVNLAQLQDNATSGFHCARYADVYKGAQPIKRMHSLYVKVGTARYIATSDFSPSTGVQRVNIFDTQTETFTHEGTFYADHGWEEIETGVYRLWYSNSIDNLAYDEQVVGISNGPLNTDWTYSGSGDTIFAGGYMVEAVPDSVTEPGPYVKTGAHNGLTRDNKGQTIRQRVEGAAGTWEASKVTVTNEAPYSNLFHDAARWEENQAAAAASTRYVRDNGIIVPLTQFDSDGVAAAGAVWLKGLTSQTLELSKIYVAEVYADANTSDWLAVSLVSLGSLSLIAYFDLANGAVGTLGADVTSADIQLTDDGLAYRCRFTFDSDAVDATGQWRIYAAEGDNDLTWSTDRSTAGIYLGGLQLHQGDPFSPYVDVPGATAVTKTFGGNVIYLNKGAVQPAGYSLPDYFIPEGWYTLPNVIATNGFWFAAVDEANGTGDWASWLYGVNDLLGDWYLPKGSGNVALNIARFYAEASGSATWARWAPGANLTNLSGVLQINMQEAFLNGFQLT
jgi:hypothetical protein